ncbi:MAG: response regulator [Pseudomonadota bacterium]
MTDILVVEDEADLCDLIADELECEGHRVTTARNGEEALHCLATKSPKIILCDINMPKLNGFQFRKAMMNQFPHFREVPFIYVSAYSEQEDIADGLITGADHYVTKPIDFDELKGIVRDSSVSK